MNLPIMINNRFDLLWSLNRYCSLGCSALLELIYFPSTKGSDKSLNVAITTFKQKKLFELVFMRKIYFDRKVD